MVTRVPHTRGDEPPGQFSDIARYSVFPTPVGMNRLNIVCQTSPAGVPHTRGDEPLKDTTVFFTNRKSPQNHRQSLVIRKEIA